MALPPVRYDRRKILINQLLLRSNLSLGDNFLPMRELLSNRRCPMQNNKVAANLRTGLDLQTGPYCCGSDWAFTKPL